MAEFKDPIGSIIIDGLRVYAYHGTEMQEKIVGNTFEVSAQLRFICEHAMRTDRLDLTINYAEVVAIIQEELSYPSKLLEHATLRIYEHIIRRFPQVTGGKIELYKIQPPISAELSKAGFAFEW